LKASHPLQYLCLYSIEVPTKEGDAFAFVAVDIFSEFLFLTGVEKNRGKRNVLKHIKLLLQQEQFLKGRPESFTLVLHKYEELRADVEKIIAPLGGHMIVDDLLVTKHLVPVIEHVYQYFVKHSK
jgi:hypothetical protein